MKESIRDNWYAGFLNLPERADRRARMERTLAELGIQACRHEGKPPSEYDLTDPRLQVMVKRTPGAIGCHFGQVGIMETALSFNRHAFVMEDDLLFCEDFWDRFDHMERFLSFRPWDILWLGATFHVNPPYWHKIALEKDAQTTDDPRMMRTFGCFCTYAYIVNVKSIAKVLGALDEILHRSMGIDWAMIQMEPEWNTYAYVPGSVIQYDNQSNIGNGVTRFSGFSKLGPYWFQNRRDQFIPEKFDWKEAKA